MTGSESFFDALKSKRESQDIEISEICEFTRIHPRYIEAIEKGDFTVLPNVYIRLFLKSYANFIGADAAKALKDYELHTTGKITQSEELTKNESNVTPASQPSIETKMDSNSQISPKQIVSGIVVIFSILLLLWWASRVTQEQTENIKTKKTIAEVAAESKQNIENEVIKSESKLPEPSSQSITDQLMNTETAKQSADLLDKFPLNDNNFLSEQFDTSITITNFILHPPYKISIHALEETKLHISDRQGDKIRELINKIVPRNWEKTFPFESTIQFEFWSNTHVSIKLNETSIDNYLQNSDRAIRGSYEAEISQLYLSFYKR